MHAEEIRQFFKGDVLDDQETLAKFSRDASVFVIRPSLVVCPKDAEDVKALVAWAASNKVPLAPRAGGSCMTGGSLTESVVVDFSRYMNRFLGVDRDAKTARVEPGMYYRDFEKETLKVGLLMPSYPASRDLCAVGGMVGNNAGGEKTLAYGKTENYIAALKVVLADGKEYVVRPLTRAELDAKCSQQDFEGQLYSRLRKLIEDNGDLLRRAKPEVSKNSAGYYLWNVWDKENDTFDLCRLIVGSQGTLGLVTEITFRLVAPKPHSLMAVMFLNDLAPLGELVNTILPFRPETLECYDDKTLKLAIRFFPQILTRVKRNPIVFAWSFLPDLWMLIRNGWPKLVILVELTGDREEEIYPRLQELRRAVGRFHLPVRLLRHEAEEEKYWVTRRESFNLLRKNVRGKHTLPVVDDLIVKPEYLPQFLPEMAAILGKYKAHLTSTIAGHAGNGNFHIIPLMDFKKPESRAIVRPLMDEVYALVLRYKGSTTAEHNDGLVRTPYLEAMYGSEVVRLFEETKAIFDPHHIFNPGKKVGGNLDWALEHMIRE